jgi:hypothetical protein
VNCAEDVEKARRALGLEVEAMVELRRAAFGIVSALGGSS